MKHIKTLNRNSQKKQSFSYICQHIFFALSHTSTMISVKKHLSNPGSYQFGQDLSVRNQRCRTNIKEGKNHDKQ